MLACKYVCMHVSDNYYEQFDVYINNEHNCTEYVPCHVHRQLAAQLSWHAQTSDVAEKGINSN